MWRKSSEGKPSSESYNPPVSAPVTSQDSVPVPASRVPSQAPIYAVCARSRIFCSSSESRFFQNQRGPQN